MLMLPHAHTQYKLNCKPHRKKKNPESFKAGPNHDKPGYLVFNVMLKLTEDRPLKSRDKIFKLKRVD